MKAYHWFVKSKVKGEVMSSKLVGMFVIFNKNNDNNKINFGHVIVFVTG